MSEEERSAIDSLKYTYIVIGGGIAGISCAEELTTLNPHAKILIITPHHLIKKICNYIKITNHIDSFDVVQQNCDEYTNKFPNINIVIDSVKSIDTLSNEVNTQLAVYTYTKSICLCLGSRPNIINVKHPLVIGLRDNSSVEELSLLLANAKQIVVCGNGGIATELVFKVKNCRIIWVVKDDCITKKFLDPGASEFIISQHLTKKLEFKEIKNLATITNTKITKDQKFSCVPLASALGPNWHINLNLIGSLPIANQNNDCHQNLVDIIYNCEVIDVQDIPKTDTSNFSLKVTLSNKEVYECDFVISATGVIPNADTFKTFPYKLTLAKSDGGILVDSFMLTNLPKVYAAGDCCTVDEQCLAPNWFQMRLWSQAFHMATIAAKCMIEADSDLESFKNEFDGHSMANDIYFDLFTHTTTFFGRKIVLLGIFNEQKLLPDREYLLRVEADEYIKVVLSSSAGDDDQKNLDIQDGCHGRKFIRGAILVGETGLEETLENLILNKIDVSPFGDELLNPNIDIEDYFD